MKQKFPAFLRKIPELFEGADEVPLFGNAPPFDWHQLSSLLATRFDAKDFSVQPTEQSWCTAAEVKEGLGTNYFCAAIHLSPLHPPLYFAIPKADKNKLTATMMQGKTKAQISEPLKEGFCRFLVLEALSASSGIEPLTKLTPSLGETAELPDESAFCIDVEISFGENSCWSRLILPSSFRRAWVEHFAMNPPEYVSHEIAKSTELVLGLECGSVALSRKQWNSLEKGDFVVLDRGSYDPIEKRSTAVLKIGTIPLFQAKVEQDKMELGEYAFTNEEIMTHDPKEGDLAAAEEESVSIKDVPLNVCVELARLKISLDKLMHLNPGNTLTLPIHPDQGVTLTVNGKKVGRAELLYLGESLGIRILEVG